MARGSNLEVQTQLEIARKLKLGAPVGLKTAESLSEEVGKMLVAMMQRF
jgi:four helix bundle protein